MNLRHVAWLLIKVLAAVLSAAVSLHAIYSAIAVDFRFDPMLTILYCLFPGLSFFVFLFVRSVRAEAATQIALFIGYAVTSSMLSWRNCSAYGYCTTAGATVLTVLRSKPMLASLGVALLTLLALVFAVPRRALGRSA
ncbi:MAG: hypothetical protein WBF42_13965 [Terracidiphilus sp.]